MIYQISSGQGPAECELGVAKLLAYLQNNYEVSVIDTSISAPLQLRFRSNLLLSKWYLTPSAAVARAVRMSTRSNPEFGQSMFPPDRRLSVPKSAANTPTSKRRLLDSRL